MSTALRGLQASELGREFDAGGWGGSVRRNSTELAGLAAELAMELAGLVMELIQPEPSFTQPHGAPAGPWAASWSRSTERRRSRSRLERSGAMV